MAFFENHFKRGRKRTTTTDKESTGFLTTTSLKVSNEAKRKKPEERQEKTKIRFIKDFYPLDDLCMYSDYIIY